MRFPLPPLVAVAMLALPAIAEANPLIFSDEQLERAEAGLWWIVGIEAALASLIFFRFFRPWWSAPLLFFPLNFLTFLGFRSFLVDVSRYGAGMSSTTFSAEVAIICIEWGAAFLALRTVYHPGRRLGKWALLAMVTFTNVAAMVLAALWTFYLEWGYDSLKQIGALTVCHVSGCA